MPFWAGMLTERQHPHPELEMAVRQAAWDLYFRDDPVCDPPDFVTDPGIDLDALLDGQPILLLLGGNAPTGRRSLPADASGDEIDAHIREVRKITNQSWSNLRKAGAVAPGQAARAVRNGQRRVNRPERRSTYWAGNGSRSGRP